MEHLLTREYARATIREIVSTDAAEELNSDEREQLIAAILAYREVTMSFAPHEFDESYTQREINSVIEKYDIKQEELGS